MSLLNYKPRKGMYIYIMERVKGRDPETGYFQKEIKVGISNFPPRRLKEINSPDGVPGKTVLRKYWSHKQAKSIERRILTLYQAKKFTPKKAGKAGGRTEWLRLDGAEYRALREDLRREINGRKHGNDILINTSMASSVLIWFFVWLLLEMLN